MPSVLVLAICASVIRYLDNINKVEKYTVFLLVKEELGIMQIQLPKICCKKLVWSDIPVFNYKLSILSDARSDKDKFASSTASIPLLLGPASTPLPSWVLLLHLFLTSFLTKSTRLFQVLGGAILYQESVFTQRLHSLYYEKTQHRSRKNRFRSAPNLAALLPYFFAAARNSRMYAVKKPKRAARAALGVTTE